MSVRRVEVIVACSISSALLLLSPIVDFARKRQVESAFTTVPELSAGFDLLYEQRFAEARKAFAAGNPQSEEPLGEVAVAASYLFEDYPSGVLTAIFS